MARKKKKQRAGVKKKSFSFFASAALITLASFFVGIYVERREQTRPPLAPGPRETEIPERILTESDDPPSGRLKSLRPEELTFYKSLLADPGKDRTDTGSENRSPGKTPEKSRTGLPAERLRKGRSGKAPSQTGTRGVNGAGLKRGKGKYRIQVASFALRSEAERMKRELQSRGFPGPIIRPVALTGKGTWYRIYVGAYGSYKEALRAEEKLHSREKLATLVVLERDLGNPASAGTKTLPPSRKGHKIRGEP